MVKFASINANLILYSFSVQMVGKSYISAKSLGFELVKTYEKT